MLQELFNDLLNVPMADITLSGRLTVVAVELLSLGSLDRRNLFEEQEYQSCNEFSRPVCTFTNQHPAKALRSNVPHVIVCISQLPHKHLSETQNALLLSGCLFEEKRMDYGTIKQCF